jgi:hypothetical protein
MAVRGIASARLAVQRPLRRVSGGGGARILVGWNELSRGTFEVKLFA